MPAKLTLKKNEERRLKLGHQWIFSNEIERIQNLNRNGDVADLYTYNYKFIGRGFYNKNSLIAYRHLTDKQEEIDRAFLFKRISMANSLRKRIQPERNTYRLVNSESDFLPGLIIDKFEDKFSYQIFSLGMSYYEDILIQILKENFKAKLIIEKNDNDLRFFEGMAKQEEVKFESDEFHGLDKTFEILIDGIRYKIDLLNGQKTGFYLDQVENRMLLRKYIKEKDRVLDLFCNEGGFALNAAYSGAKDITAVDASSHSIKMGIENAKLNNFDFINFVHRDVFKYFDIAFQSPDKFDVVILDPPSFTKTKKNIPTAMQGYIEVNYKAMRLLKPNSLLFTYSCSHHISEKNFEEVLVKSALEAKKNIQILEFSSSSFDHPVLPQMPETKYLKGYVVRVL
jgi:23S rRNA (cytosine1962-C5)-methyltransferase